jgi:hypothetical protein
MLRTTLLARFLFSFVILAVVVAPLAADPVPIKKTTGTFTAGGKAIPVEQFEPKAPGTHPAIILVRGSDGLEKFPAIPKKRRVISRAIPPITEDEKLLLIRHWRELPCLA